MNTFSFITHNYVVSDEGELEFQEPKSFEFETDRYEKEEFIDSFGKPSVRLMFSVKGKLAADINKYFDFAKDRLIALDIDDQFPIKGIVKRARVMKHLEILSEPFEDQDTYSYVKDYSFSIILSVLPDLLWEQLVG